MIKGQQFYQALDQLKECTSIEREKIAEQLVAQAYLQGFRDAKTSLMEKRRQLAAEKKMAGSRMPLSFNGLTR